MKEFTRTSVLEPAEFSYRGLDLNRLGVYLQVFFASNDGF